MIIPYLLSIDHEWKIKIISFITFLLHQNHGTELLIIFYSQVQRGHDAPLSYLSRSPSAAGRASCLLDRARDQTWRRLHEVTSKWPSLVSALFARCRLFSYWSFYLLSVIVIISLPLYMRVEHEYLIKEIQKRMI